MPEKIIKKVILLGSGGLRIGQAGEFDYSGSQALKAFREEDIFTVLINPNIATVQTDQGMADCLYLQPLNLTSVTQIIKREKPDGILLGFGGQTALNLGLRLEASGILKKYGVEVLGTPITAIKITEDRELFKQALSTIQIKTPHSFTAATIEEAQEAAKKIGYPVMMRSGFSLGGLDSGVIKNSRELHARANEAIHNSGQILIEEYLGGWKEIEYEIVRDKNDTVIAVCNMENLDPMGIHTGESIVVAPSQTLNNTEYHLLREISIRVARTVGIIGECNIQFALNPKNGDYRVIEMNARLSRSSALASKATGYPLAFIAAKLALGKKLHELSNSVTKKTSACFEPALDYLVVKMPRWDMNKFKILNRSIGSEMKSVGEVMAIDRSFPEALQKAVRMLNIGAHGLTDHPFKFNDLEKEISQPTDKTIFAAYEALKKGYSVEKIHNLSQIDRWFLHHLAEIVKIERIIKKKPLTIQNLSTAKKFGFSDKTIAKYQHTTEQSIRKMRLKNEIIPVIKQIDTLGGEFAAETNYLYLTYHGVENDLRPSKKAPVLIIGSGPYCIGSSVEFDWCSVNTARTLRKLKESPIVINSNPETVSTDYDESDRLYLEELTLERIQDIADWENPKGIMVSVGGQIANNLAPLLHANGYPLLGTTAEFIDQAENRQKFSLLLNNLHIDQPAWEEAGTLENAKKFALAVGFPVIIRPSYILSGTAMNIVYDEIQLKNFLEEAAVVSSEYPVVISKFIDNAKELEIDGVANKGEIVIYAISEHIENAGVHSGDATMVLPPQRLYLETVRSAKNIARQIARSLKITGPFNLQFIAKNNELKVIECNLRASRSFPFVSKVTNNNFIAIATEVAMGKFRSRQFQTLDLDHVGVKTPQFSYQRIKEANPVAGVEMSSTGEVACLGKTYQEAFFTSWLATEQNIDGKNILLSINKEKRAELLEQIIELDKQDWNIYATEGTHDFLSKNGIASTFLYKADEASEPNILTAIAGGKIDVIINIPSGSGGNHSGGFKIRRLAVNQLLPIITNRQIAKLFLSCLTRMATKKIIPLSWQDYINNSIT